MATFLAIPPTAVSGLAALSPVAIQRLATTGTSAASATVVADSTSVTLSAAAQVLAAIGGTAIAGSNALGTALNDGVAATPASTDAVASERRTFNATQALQNLIDDPGLRAIRNQSDPLYSALIAAAHLSDFVPAALGTDLGAIAADVPAPVRPIAASRAIDFYRETAGETWRQLAA